MEKETTLDDLKKSIYDLMKSYFRPSDIAHEVGKDFSEQELSDFIGCYHNYIMK